MAKIATTFYAWSEEHNLDLPTGGRKYINCISDKNEDEDDKEHAVLITIDQAKKNCGFCRLTHPTDNCHKLLNYLQVEEYFNNNPKMKKELKGKPLQKRKPYGYRRNNK
eukprot:6136172-Ditylum_brightwellii.AAC.1